MILEIAMSDPGLLDGSVPVVVVVDDGIPMHAWKERRTSNNKMEGPGSCAMPGRTAAPGLVDVGLTAATRSAESGL